MRECPHCHTMFELGTGNTAHKIYCTETCRLRHKQTWGKMSPHRKAGVCRRSKKRKRSRFLRQVVHDIKAWAGCKHCPENHPACLQFHHREPKEKLFSIAHAITHGGVGLKRLLEEIVKCDVVCANCHLKHHAENPVPSDVRMVV
jgi:hypothetical protein